MKILEKLKNKKVFVFYLLGVLLLSFGVSFAYFLATSSVGGDGVVGTNVTATVQSDGVVADGNFGFQVTDIYPGHTEIASIKVTGTGSNQALMFDVVFNGNNTFNTPINYTIYKSDRNIDASYTCEKKKGVVGTSKSYYEECTGNNIDELGTSIGSGTINKGEGITTFKSDEVIVTSEEGTEVYYYVVIEFPNSDTNQNEDMGASISGNITIQEGNKYQQPELFITENLTSGNNGWYRGAILTTNITTQTGNYQAEYCITSEDSCIPNETASITNNSFDVTLDSNSASQKLCVRVTDEYNQIGEGCSNSYKVDNTNPTVNITSSEVTENSISITVSGNDAHSGIDQYKFSSNGGSTYTTISSTNNTYTYTFNNLNGGTTYNIAVQVVDKSGRVSSVVTKSVETERISAKDTILANYPTILTRTNFNTTVTTTTTGTIYKSADSSQYDNDGEVYYFAGNPTDNWVKFGGFYWRIIRINGDGTIRLIYQGTSANTTGTRTQTGTSSFNGSYSNNMYVGFKYTSGSVQGTGTNSTIKGVLDSWYNSNLKNYVDRIDGNAGFCNDRTLYSGSGTGTAITYYAAYYRLYANNSPSFKCSNSSDLFTLSSASKGNKALTYPIGLIAADEVVYAGGVYGQINGSYYLYTRQNYWTMSPNCFDGDYARMFFVISDGDLGDGIVRNALGVRPVINLKADTLFTGTGTTTDPYVVS